MQPQNTAIQWMVFLIRVGACEFYLWFYLFSLFNKQLFIEYLLLPET